MPLYGDEDGNGDCDGDERSGERGSDERPFRDEEEIESDHAEKSEEGQLHGNLDESGTIERERKNVKNGEESDSERIDLERSFGGSVLVPVEEMKYLWRVYHQESNHGEKEKYHQAERFIDEILRFFRVACGSRLGNSGKEDDGEGVEEVIRDASGRESGVVDTGEVVASKKAFDEVEIESEDEFVEKQEEGEWSSVGEYGFFGEGDDFGFRLFDVRKVTMGDEDVGQEAESEDEERRGDIARYGALDTEEVGEADDEDDTTERTHYLESRLEAEEMQSGIVVKVEGCSSEGGDDEGGKTEERSEARVVEEVGEKRCSEKKEDRDGRHEQDLQSYGLALDAEYFFGGAFEDFSQVLGHGGRDSVADQDDDHGREGHDETVAAIIGRTENAADGRLDDVAGDIEDNFGNGEPDKCL